MKPARSLLPVLFGALLSSAIAVGAPAPAPAPTPPSTSSAAPAPPPTVRDTLPPEGVTAWDRAVELYEALDYEGARIEFLRAYELSKNPRVLFNVGVCDKSLRRYARAAATWKRELHEGGNSLTDDDRAKVEAAIQKVEEFVSTARIESTEAGATVLVDGETIGTTPLAAPLPIDVGRHTIVLRKEGFVEQSKELTVGSEVASARFELVPVGATVQVTVRGPKSANVLVDGTDMGPAPFRGEVPAGRHSFKASAPGFVTSSQTSEVESGKALDIALVLAPERKEGKLRVTATEADAEIRIDGQPVGVGSWEGVLPTGGHRLVVRRDGFTEHETDVALESGQARAVDVTLEREAGAADWVWWMAGSISVATGLIVAGYFVFSPAERTPVSGTLTPGLVEAGRMGGGGLDWSMQWKGAF
jgi:hypothetical protein